jgi:hypothetical protein
MFANIHQENSHVLSKAQKSKLRTFFSLLFCMGVRNDLITHEEKVSGQLKIIWPKRDELSKK